MSNNTNFLAFEKAVIPVIAKFPPGDGPYQVGSLGKFFSALYSLQGLANRLGGDINDHISAHMGPGGDALNRGLSLLLKSDSASGIHADLQAYVKAKKAKQVEVALKPGFVDRVKSYLAYLVKAIGEFSVAGWFESEYFDGMLDGLKDVYEAEMELVKKVESVGSTALYIAGGVLGAALLLWAGKR